VQYLLLTPNAFQMKNYRYCISNLRLERSFKAHLLTVMHQATAAVALLYLLFPGKSVNFRNGVSDLYCTKNQVIGIGTILMLYNRKMMQKAFYFLVL
jgi:hypothetical protein